MHRLLSALALLAAGCACERGIGLSGEQDADASWDGSDPDGDVDPPLDTASPDEVDHVGGCTIERESAAFMDESCWLIRVMPGEEAFDELDIEVNDSLGEFHLEITSYPLEGGPLSTGTFFFSSANFEECVLCGILTTGYGSLGMRLLIVSGTFTISELGLISGGRFVATLTDLVAIQVAILPSSIEGRYRSEPVPDGEVLCIGSMAFDTEVHIE